MLTEGHIFTIKTKDPQNVADIQNVATGVVISGLNVLKEQIRVGDFVFVVFGGDKPPWKTGLVGIALISRAPFDEGYDGKKNFRVGIDIKAYFEPITRGDLVTYPDTFDTIGIGPITKWEPNQAITSVLLRNAKGLLQAICDLRPGSLEALHDALGNDFDTLPKEVRRFVPGLSLLSHPMQTQTSHEAADRLTVALKMYAAARGREGPAGWESYDAWTHGVREEFAEVNEGWLEAEGFDYGELMRKYAISWQVANSKFSVHTVEERRAVLGFLREQRAVPKAVSWYLEEGNRLKVGGKAVVGMGAATVLYFLSELRPEEFAAWSEPTYGALAFLGLHKGAVPPGLSVESYEDCKGKQRRIAERMGELGIGKASDDGSAADYRTVNEFLWWLKENQEAVKEVAMRKQLKDGKPAMHAGARKALSFAPDSKEDELLLRLLAALRAKPFAILAGHSGTGKSRYAKKLAYMTCNAVELRKEGRLPGNYLLLQVRPNWHDSTELLGFRNAMDGNRYQKTKLIEFLFRAYQFKETPFFLCLDEMNLAPVEQYFAEFLSSMESAEPVPLNDLSAEDDNLFELGCEWKAAYEHLAANGFSIPRNLFVVGTVNMDETTNQFSRKVLDRAFTIEMTDVDFRNYGHVAPPGYGDTIGEEMIQALLQGEKFVETLDPEDVADGAPLVRVQKALEPTAFAIAYRFANEYTLLKRAIACFDPSGAMKLDALDQAVLMKILPRVAGERDYIEQVYGKNEDEGLRKALEGKAVSLQKIAEIMKRARDMNAQYITFWP